MRFGGEVCRREEETERREMEEDIPRMRESRIKANMQFCAKETNTGRRNMRRGVFPQ